MGWGWGGERGDREGWGKVMEVWGNNAGVGMGRRVMVGDVAVHNE